MAYYHSHFKPIPGNPVIKVTLNLLETPADSSGYCHERGAKSVHGSRNHHNILEANNHALERVSLGKPLMGSANDETEISDPPGQLIFEYFEHESPYAREPLADKARCYPLIDFQVRLCCFLILTSIHIA